MLLLSGLIAGCSQAQGFQPLTPAPISQVVLPTAAPTSIPTAVPTFTPSPTPTAAPSSSPTPTPLSCWQEGGEMVVDQLRTSLLPLPLEYRVYLPPCYQEEPERRYPVLYLIHGQSYTDDQWDRLGADEAVDRLVAEGEVSPFIIVMPRDRNWAQPSQDPFGQVVVEELIPFIDENYRTLPQREYRAVGGLSRGAAWSVHLGLSRWELFGSIGAHSLPVFWEDTRYLRTWLDTIPRESLPRIYMDTGEKDYLIRSTLWFEELLTEKSIPHEWYLFSGYHEEAYWASHIEQYIRWYAQEW
ncbi:MAG: esterase family protein [Chloroflexi bacterium]|nr:esterase family protein [Chloroflexota bacterium]